MIQQVGMDADRHVICSCPLPRINYPTEIEQFQKVASNVAALSDLGWYSVQYAEYQLTTRILASVQWPY